MVTSKFDDSLDGSISKPNTNPLILDNIEKQPRVLNGIAKHMKELGIETDERVLEIIDKDKEVTALGIANKYDIPDRTAGSSLARLKRKGILTSSYEMRRSGDGKRRLNNVYRRVEKKNERKRNNKKV